VGVGTANQVLAKVTAESIRGVQGKVLPIGLQYRQFLVNSSCISHVSSRKSYPTGVTSVNSLESAAASLLPALRPYSPTVFSSSSSRSWCHKHTWFTRKLLKFAKRLLRVRTEPMQGIEQIK